MWKLLNLFKATEISVPLRKVVGIRLEAIGGQGANSAGKILAESAVMGMGYSGNHFSSFGSEKRGAPVRSFVKFSTLQHPIRSATTIHQPQVLVIFHESLIQSHQEVLEGSNEVTDVIINTSKKAHQLKFPVGFKCRNLMTIDASKLMVKYNCGLNAVMLGALCLVLPEIEQSVLLNYFLKFFSRLSEKQILANEEGFKAGHDKSSISVYQMTQSSESIREPQLPEMGWANAPFGGVIENPGNTILKDHSSSRKGFVPVLHEEICFHCGHCDMVCPDFCFVWQIGDKAADKNKDIDGLKTNETASDKTTENKLLGIDYQYCKGCQKCVEVCPIQALQLIPEEQLTEKQKQHKLFK